MADGVWFVREVGERKGKRKWERDREKSASCPSVRPSVYLSAQAVPVDLGLVLPGAKTVQSNVRASSKHISGDSPLLLLSNIMEVVCTLKCEFGVMNSVHHRCCLLENY